MATVTRKRPGTRLPARTAIRLPAGSAIEGTRGRVLTAALGLFAHKGFHGTSIRDIADSAGMQTSTMYGQFASKEAILEELMAYAHEAYESMLVAAVEAVGPDASPRERLVALTRANVLHHIRYAMAAVVGNGELHSLGPEAASRIAGLRRQGEDLLEQIISDGAADGSFEPLDPGVTMAALGSMGLRVANWYPGRVDYSPDELADLYAEFALRLVGAKA